MRRSLKRKKYKVIAFKFSGRGNWIKTPRMSLNQARAAAKEYKRLGYQSVYIREIQSGSQRIMHNGW